MERLESDRQGWMSQGCGYLFGMLLVLGLSIACTEREQSPPVAVHILGDPTAPFAKNVRQGDLQFGLPKARLNSGRWIMVATNESSSSYPTLVRRLADTSEDLLILDSASDLTDSATVRDRAGKPQLISGEAQAYIPDWVSGEQREATEISLRFLVAYCEEGGFIDLRSRF